MEINSAARTRKKSLCEKKKKRKNSWKPIRYKMFRFAAVNVLQPRWICVMQMFAWNCSLIKGKKLFSRHIQMKRAILLSRCKLNANIRKSYTYTWNRDGRLFNENASVHCNFWGEYFRSERGNVNSAGLKVCIVLEVTKKYR